MTANFSFDFAKQIDNTLQGGDWPEGLTLRQLVNIHFKDSAPSRQVENGESWFKVVCEKLDDSRRSGNLIFDNIGVTYTWNSHVNVSVGSYLSGPGQEWIMNYLHDEQKQCEQQKCLEHAPNGGWMALLSGVGLYEAKALEGHACGCKAICTVTGVFKNGLPKYWNVEGAHDDGLWINFSCHAVPLLTPAQYFRFCADNGTPDPGNSLLKYWRDKYEADKIGVLKDGGTQEGPSCGKWAIHKLIDRAFYSIDKPVDKITANDVFEAIKYECDNKLTAIDDDNLIKSIKGKVITWWSKGKSGESNCSWDAFESAVDNLKKRNGCR